MEVQSNFEEDSYPEIESLSAMAKPASSEPKKLFEPSDNNDAQIEGKDEYIQED
jgi:hypothetical protein